MQAAKDMGALLRVVRGVKMRRVATQRGDHAGSPLRAAIWVVVVALLVGCGAPTAEPSSVDVAATATMARVGEPARVDAVATATVAPAGEPAGDDAVPAVTPATAVPAQEQTRYSPAILPDWRVSTPAEQGLDAGLVDELYEKASRLPNLYGLLVVKNGYLVAEGYFNGEGFDSAHSVASVNKSYVSALAGIALREGILSDLDQRMMHSFPEYAGRSGDPRKEQITIRQVLQMRSGYPWEEFSGDLDRLGSSANWLPLLVEFELDADPGTQFGYSNLTAHVMGVILARESGRSLRELAEAYLFEPLGAEVRCWPRDAAGYYYGSGGLCVTARDMAKFGQLYLDGGVWQGRQVIPAEWVSGSLQPYSRGIYGNRLGDYFRQIEYGYLWWSARAGSHHFGYAWGHGGNLIVVVQDLEMVVVTTADDLPGEFGETAWAKERAVIDLVGAFIASIPK